MSLLARVELFKLATVRASYSLWAATVGLTIMFGAIEASRAGSQPARWHRSPPLLGNRRSPL